MCIRDSSYGYGVSTGSEVSVISGVAVRATTDGISIRSSTARYITDSNRTVILSASCISRSYIDISWSTAAVDIGSSREYATVGIPYGYGVSSCSEVSIISGVAVGASIDGISIRSITACYITDSN